MSVKLNEPINWRDFKRLSREMREEYLTHLKEKYGVNQSALGEMFGVTAHTVSRILREECPGVTFSRGSASRMTASQLVAWRDFLSGEQSAAADSADAGQRIAVEESPNADKPEECRVSGFSVSFTGGIDPYAVLASLAKMLEGYAAPRGRVFLSVELDE